MIGWTARQKGLRLEVGRCSPKGNRGSVPLAMKGALMTHIAATNFQFCAGWKDTQPPALATPADKQGTVKFLSDSFAYCSEVISSLTPQQMEAVHDSPDGRLPGREVLLAMFVHVAHHRGQAEIYLRDKGIRPPPYRI